MNGETQETKRNPATSYLTPYLGPWAVLALSFGYAVGWGAFVMPGRVFLPDAGPLGTMIGIVLGAVAMTIFALNYHRMILREPGPGGAVRFARKVFGEDHGFLVGWFLSLAYIAILWANATSIVLLERYLFGDALQFGFHYTVVGFDVYLGEVVLPIAAIVGCGVLCMYGKRLVAQLQMCFAFVLVASVALFFAVAVLRHEGGVAAMGPAFSSLSGSAPWLQILQIFAMMPWAFVGFEAIANSSVEFRFSTKKTFGILLAAIAISAVVYAFLALLPVVAVPEGYASWVDYIRAKPNLIGTNAVCVFAATRKLFGSCGTAFVGAAMLAGQLTGIFGAYVATSRLIYCLSRNEALPSWFGELNRDANPRNAILFIMLASVAVPLLGRTAIAWPVDVSTIGAVLAYGYTSAAAFKAHGSTGVGKILSGKMAGLIGIVISALLGLFLLIPTYLSGTTLAPEAYLLLSIWCILGFLLYRREFRLDRHSRFGHSIIVWVSVILMIFFSSLMWVRQSACDALDEVVAKFSEDAESSRRLADLIGEVDGKLLADAFIEMGLLVVTLWVMISLFSILRRREQNMAVEKTKAEEINKAKSLFFSTVSHDIRTPLNAIIGFSQMLSEGFKTEAETREAVDSILVSGKTLLSLINDVLDLSKLEAGRMPIEPEPTSCGELLDELVKAFRITHSKPNLEIRARVSKMSPLMLDPQRVRQIVFNLVGNAVKFTEKGYVEVRADFRADEGADEGVFTLYVEDTGAGISEEDQKLIATPYQQFGSKDARSKGTGLGLAICRQLSAAMGGGLALESELGRGTTFIITLPNVKIASEEELAKAKSAEDKPDSADGGEHFKLRNLLLVDDQKMNLMVLKAMLLRMGTFELTMAHNGKEALDILTRTDAPQFDLVLTDMWMPEMSGETLVHKIRSIPKLAALPVFALTADVEARKNYAAIGFSGILLKPITAEGLKTILSWKK